jgi:hypothetical protein
MLKRDSETQVSSLELFALAGIFTVIAAKGYFADDLAAWIYLVGFGVVRLLVFQVQTGRVRSLYARTAAVLAVCLSLVHLVIWRGQSWGSIAIAIVYSAVVFAYATGFAMIRKSGEEVT